MFAIGSLVNGLTPNTRTNMLAAFQDQRLTVWAFPAIAFADRDLLGLTMIHVGAEADLGRSALIVRFIGNTITVRRSDGTLIQNYVPPFVSALYQLVRDGQWDQAIRICRTIKEDYLWAILAGMAVNQRVYNIAETCYVQLKEAEKVQFLRNLSSESIPQMKTALIAEFNGRSREADSALIQSGRHFSAIVLNLSMFRFERALELALKWNNGRHLDTVLGHRQRYLAVTGRKENDPTFMKHLSQVEIDWPHILEKMHEDEQAETRT